MLLHLLLLKLLLLELKIWVVETSRLLLKESVVIRLEAISSRECIKVVVIVVGLSKVVGEEVKVVAVVVALLLLVQVRRSAKNTWQARCG